MSDTAHIRDGFVGFANERILPHLPKTQQFLAGMAIGMASAKADATLAGLAELPAAKMLGIVSGSDIDVDAVYRAAKDQMRRTGSLVVEVPMIGTLTFREDDLDSLYQHIRQGG